MKKRVVVNDKMQRNYKYVLSASTGKNFDPEFKPELTPKEIIEEGEKETKKIIHKLKSGS